MKSRERDTDLTSTTFHCPNIEVLYLHKRSIDIVSSS
jgi:hypothetical protein